MQSNNWPYVYLLNNNTKCGNILHFINIYKILWTKCVSETTRRHIVSSWLVSCVSSLITQIFFLEISLHWLDVFD